MGVVLHVSLLHGLATVAQSSEEKFAFCAREDQAANWIVDSGASSHMSANRHFFESMEEPHGDTPRSVTVADGKKETVKGVGSCKIFCYGHNGEAKEILLSGVLYVPELDMNLVSVGRLVQKGAKVTFDEMGCTIASGNRIAAIAPWRNHLRMVEQANVAAEPCHEKGCVHEWHRKLGHRDVQAVLDLERRQLATGIKVRKCNTNVTCESCLQEEV